MVCEDSQKKFWLWVSVCQRKLEGRGCWMELRDKKGRRSKRRTRGKEAPFYTRLRRVFPPTGTSVGESTWSIETREGGWAMLDQRWGASGVSSDIPPSSRLYQFQALISVLLPLLRKQFALTRPGPRSGPGEVQRMRPAHLQCPSQ
jgi:hypothetical protein